MRARPSRSCTSSSSRGTSISGAPSSRCAQPPQRGAVARGEHALLVPGAHHLARERLARAAPPPRRPRRRWWAGTGMRTRLATTPANGSSASRSRSWKKAASSSESSRGEVTTTNVLRSCGEQRVDLAGALAEALDHPAEAAEELGQVREQVHAGGPLHRAEEHAAAAAEQLQAQHARPREQLERRRVDERGQLARRVEEVERVPGRRRVEHQQVVDALAVELVELLHRHVLLRAGHGVRQLAVDRVGRAPSRACARRARAAPPARRRCASGRASSPTARPSPARPRGAPRVPSSSSPSAWASRRAGSIVSTATFAAAGGHARARWRRRWRSCPRRRARRTRTPPCPRASGRSQPPLQHARQPLELRRGRCPARTGTGA